MNKKHILHVTVWNEYRVEREDASAAQHYPRGLHDTIARRLNLEPDLEAATATLDEPDQGLGLDRLARTDVLLWWAHRSHHELDDERVKAVAERVHEGMGLVILHSAHFAKPFIRLMGTSCKLGRWDESGERETLRTLLPDHPVAEGVGKEAVLGETEMYGEPFDVPEPDEVIFKSNFEHGAVFRSGCVWHRGRGRVFYFRPGHEIYPIYHNETVQRILCNAARWLGRAGVTA